MPPSSDGTVRGTFDLNVGPAVRGVREYRREAAAADVQTRQLGGTMDDTFGREKALQIKVVSDATEALGRKTTETRAVVAREWATMARDVEGAAAKMYLAIGHVREEMHRLGAERATPTVDVDGIAEAIAQVELLERRLNSLSRQRATPRVAVGGGFAPGGGGGGRVSRGGRVPNGGGGDGLRSVGVGPLNLGSRLGLGLIGGALPAVQALTGGATALAGSLTGASLGAGAVGLSAGGALAAGIGAVVAVAKPATTELSNAMKAQQKYTAAVADFGRKSKEAATAKRDMEQAFGDDRGLRRATRSITGFKSDWHRLTAPGRASYFGMLGNIAQTGQRVAPNLASYANRSTAAVSTAGSNYASFLARPETLGTLDKATTQFTRELPTIERSLENMTLTVERLYRAASPFFHEADDWVEKWTGGLAESTRDTDAVRQKMQGLVDEAKDWRDLSGSTFRLLRDIFKLSAPSGDSLVVSLTHTMDRWDAWVKSNPQQVRGFFHDTANSVREMATALSGVVHWLNQMATLLRPLLDRFSQLVGLASKLGLIGAPGSLMAVRGALGGLRGPGGGGRAGGGVIVGGGGGGGVAALAAPASRSSRLRALTSIPKGYTRSTYNTARDVGYSRTGSALTAGGGLVAGGALGAGRLGLGALRGAARAYLPVAAGLSALDFASFQGSVSDKIGAVGSDFTMGAISRPLTGDQMKDKGSQAAQSLLQGIPQGRAGLARLRSLVSQARGELNSRGTSGPIERAAGTKRAGGIAGLFGGVDNKIGGSGVRAGLDVLQEELAARKRLVAEMDKEQVARKDERSKVKAQQYAGGLQGAFQTYRKAGDDPTKAFGATLDQVETRLKHTRDAGVETLGDASLAWAKALAKGNPAMKAQVKDLTDSILDRYRKLNGNVQIVNGNILTGTRTQWQGIRDAMDSATEQAKEKTSTDFTAIQQQAVGALRAMGFTGGQATNLVKGLEKGGAAGRVAKSDAKSGPNAEQLNATDRKKYARGGGVIGGRGLMDTVPVSGGMAAPGEAWIANRHTLADMSRATVEKFGLTAQQMIAGETRRHSARFATGGLAPAEGALVGRLGRMGFKPTSTTGGTHAPNSYHYRGMAADFGNSMNDLPRLWSVLFPQRRRFAELFGPTSMHPKPTLMHFGQGFADAGLQAEHNDHIHVALTGGKVGRLRGGGAGGAGAGGGPVGRVNLHGLGMRQGGVPGILRNRAGDLYAAALQQKINKHLGAGGGMGGYSPRGGGVLSYRQVARLAESVGLPGITFAQIAKGESGFNPRAVGHDPGGTQGLGLWQITTGYNDDIIKRFGGRDAMFNPRTNARAAKAIYDRAGIGAWYGTRYMTSPDAHYRGNARGGKLAWGGGFKDGGSMVTNGPTAFVAGEGTRRRERVTVTPANARSTGGGMTVKVEKGAVQVHIHGLKGGGDVEKLAEEVGEKIVVKIIDALDRGAGVVG